MKKTLQTLVLLLLLSATVKSQTTYYWVGGNGTTAARIAWNNPASWNTAIDGTGTSRTTPTSTDILIFDGSAPSLSANKLVYIDAARDSIAQLQLVNGVTVTVVSTVAGNTDVAGAVTYGTAISACVMPIYGTNFTSIFKLGDYVSTNATNTNMSQVIGINGPDTLYVAAENALAANTAATLYKATTIYITGNPGLTIDATSIFNYGLGGTTTMNCLVLKLTNTATGNIYGQFNFQGRGPAGRLCATTAGSLRFKAGSSCYNGTNHGAITPNPQPYAFGHPMTTGSLAAGNLVFVSGETVVFEKGATFTHAQVGSGGSAYKMNSPFGITSNLGNTIYPFVPSVSFLPGSNYVFAYGNGYPPYFYSGAAARFGNLKFTGGGMPISASGKTNITLNAAYIDTLFLTSTNTGVNTANNGTINVYGGIVNNNAVAVNLGAVNFKGSSVAPAISGATATSFNTTSFSSGIANNSTSTTAVNFGNAMFIGNNVQTVTTGATTLAPAFGTITLADNSVFQLSQNTTVTGAITNNGTLNVATYTIDGGTAGSFINNSATNRTYNQPNGSNEVSGGVKTTANSTAFFIRGVNSTTVPIGSTISSTSHPSIFPAGTYVASYSSGGNFTASNPATITADSTSTPALSLTFTNSAGTFVTASTSGMDGSLINMASSTLNTGASYIFNAATATPFSSAAASTINAGNITLTGATTLNKHLLNVTGNLTLGTGNLTVNTGDTIIVKSGATLTGGSPSRFIDTKVNVATGSKGVFGIEGFSTERTFPVGTNGHFLPISITPTVSSDFYVTAFNGATVDGTPNGTALTTAQKDTSVDAIYFINRTVPASGNPYTLKMGYPTSLKGTTFATYTNQIGISNYNGSSWSVAHGSGDNNANTATDTASTSGAFYITHNSTPVILPVKLGALSAIVIGANSVKVSWNVYDEVNIDQYLVEASSNGVSFTAVGAVKASGNATYSLVDNNASGAVVYYRVKSIDKGTGAISYSAVVSIALNAAKVASVNVYPNPVVGSELHIQTTNFKAGKLYVMLYDNQGKQIAQQALTYNGGAMAQTLALSNAVKAGTYQLVVTDGTSSISKTIFVVR